MNEAVLFKLVDLALNAVAIGLERDLIVSKVKEMEANGSTPQQVADALKDMRDQAILRAQDAINQA
jgi:fatty acid-binding protein DegV